MSDLTGFFFVKKPLLKFIEFMIELVIFGFIVGLSLGLSGGGGSIFAVPLLVYGAKVPVHQALLFSLITVGVTAFIGALQRIFRSEVNFKASFVIVATSVVFAPCGAYVSQSLSGHVIMIGFALMMFVVGTLMWSQGAPHSHKSKKHPLVLVAGGAVTSFLNGLFGVGGGFLIVPTLIFSTSLAIKKAMATSLFVIACVSLISTISHIVGEPKLDFSLLAFFLLGGVIGVTVGGKAVKNIKENHLHKGFSLMIVFVGLLVLLKEFIYN